MKNRKTIIRLVCLALMVAMVAPIIASCKRADPVSAAVKEHVYKAEYFPMPEEFTYFNNAVVRGGKVYAVVDSMGEDGNYGQQIVAIDIASGEYDVLPFEMKNEYSENSSSYTYVSSMKMDGDGNLILVVTSSTSNMNPATNEWIYDEKSELVTLNAESGAEVNRLDLSSLKENMDEYSYFYVQNAAVVDNYVVVTTGENIYVLDSATGKKAFDIPFEGWVNEMFVTNGRLLLSMYDYSASSGSYGLKELDFNTRSFVDSEIDLPGESYRYTFISGDGYDLYLNDGMSLYGYDIKTNGMTELLNWIDSDIDADSLNSISPVSAEEIFCIGYNYSNGGRSGMEVTRLTKVDPKDVVEKTILTMAVQYLGYDVRKAIIAFNKSNEKYRITVNDYSKYNTEDNYSAGSEKLNTDLISGVVPDIIYVDSYNMPVDSFIAKGLFADLYPLMDKDPDFNREDYLQNVFEAYSRDGKLYSVISAFFVYTVMGKASDVGTTMGWTMDELNAIMATKPEGMMSFANTSRDSVLMMSTFMSLDSFIDKATGKCSFDDGNFAKLLEFAAQFPSQEEIEMGYSTARSSERASLAVASGSYIGGGYDVYVSDEERIRNGEALIQMVYLYEYNDYQMKKVAYGEEPTYIGFPASQGIGSVLMGDMEFALYSKSKNLDGGWEFIKYFLSDEHQSTIEWSFPVKISRLEELAKAAMEPPSYTWTDENGVEHVETYTRTYWIGGQSVELGDMTQAEIDKVNELLFAVNTAMVYDNKVQEIITEEAEAFFNGQRSAQDAAGIVQSRVQTYISENR